jgi:hypothetical protein
VSERPLGGGRAKIENSLEATRRSFNKDFLLALAADFKKHGAAAIEKIRRALASARKKSAQACNLRAMN